MGHVEPPQILNPVLQRPFAVASGLECRYLRCRGVVQHDGEDPVRMIVELEEMESILAGMYSALPEVHGFVDGVLVGW